MNLSIASQQVRRNADIRAALILVALAAAIGCQVAAAHSADASWPLASSLAVVSNAVFLQTDTPPAAKPAPGAAGTEPAKAATKDPAPSPTDTPSSTNTPSTPVAKPESPATPSAPPARSFRLQESDDEPLPLESTQTAADLARTDARAWYATGRVLEERNDLTGALDAYRRALQNDPKAIDAIRALIPLAFNQGLTDEAMTWSSELVRLDAGSFELFRKLAEYEFRQGNLPGALNWLEQASKATDADRESPLFVLVQLQLARLYREVGKTVQAADAFAVVMDALQSPEKFKLNFQTKSQLLNNSGELYEQMAEAFLDAGRGEPAKTAFNKWAEARKASPGALGFQLARVYLLDKQFDLAATELQKYFDAQLQSRGRAAYQLLVDILRSNKRDAELLPKLQQLADDDENNSTLQFFYADELFAAGQFDAAEQRYKSALAKGDDSAGFAGLARLYRSQKRVSDLISTLSKGFQTGGEIELIEPEIKAIASDEELCTAVLTEGEKRVAAENEKLTVGVAYILARIAVGGSRTPQAVRFYQIVLKERRDLAGIIYEELGQHLLEAREFTEAARIFTEAVGDDAASDKRIEFQLSMSQALGLAGKKTEALAALEQVRRTAPPGLRLYTEFQEAWIYFNAHELPEAARRFEELSKNTDQSAQGRRIAQRSLFTLSSVLVQMGELARGEAILEELFRNNPEEPQANNDLGYLWADQGKNLEQAETMIRKALAAEPDNGSYLDSLAWVLFKRGKPEEALVPIEKAIKIPTNNADETLWDHYGDILNAAGKTDAAVAAWNKALKLGEKSTRRDDKLMQRIKQKLMPTASGS